jgi:hypothetical protein
MTRLTTVSLCLCIALCAAAQTAPDPFAGQWVLDLNKWEFDIDSQPKKQTLRFEGTAASARILIEGTNHRDEPIRIERNLQFGAAERPANDGGGAWDAVSDRRIDSLSIESTYRKAGKTVRTTRYTLSKDQQTLTILSSGTNPKGVAFKVTEVYQRPKPAAPAKKKTGKKA